MSKASVSQQQALAKAMQKPLQRGYDDVVVTSPFTVPYVRYSPRSAHWFLGRALRGTIEASGVTLKDIDGLCVSSFQLMPDTAVGLTQHLGVTPRWLDHQPMGGACGIVALRRAARAVQMGDANIVACISGDANHVDTFRQMLGSFSQYAQDAVYPYGSGGPNASFAFLTDYYMRQYGATREDFGKLCVAQRTNALANDNALFKVPLSLEQYMDAREIASPLHLFDCVMPCAGGEAFTVMRRETAEALGLGYATILSTIERHNAFPDDPIQMRGGWVLDKDEMYEVAGVTPSDIDFFCTYDDYPIINAMQLEDLGFCEKGEAPQFIRSHSFEWDGDLPMNPSGGQLSVGQAGAAGGYLGLVEAVRQLTDAPTGHQVPDAQIGLVSGFGMINYDRGVCTGAAILGRGKIATPADTAIATAAKTSTNTGART